LSSRFEGVGDVTPVAADDAATLVKSDGFAVIPDGLSLLRLGVRFREPATLASRGRASHTADATAAAERSDLMLASHLGRTN